MVKVVQSCNVCHGSPLLSSFQFLVLLPNMRRPRVDAIMSIYHAKQRDSNIVQKTNASTVIGRSRASRGVSAVVDIFLGLSEIR